MTADLSLQQLIDSLKRLVNSNSLISIPLKGAQKQLSAKSRSNIFIIDINRKGNRLPKFTLQLRETSQKELPLLRLDILGPAHSNPEGDFPFAGETIECPHLHIAHPILGDRVAYPLNHETANLFLSESELDDLILILKRFLERCNIGNISEFNFNLQSELF